MLEPPLGPWTEDFPSTAHGAEAGAVRGGLEKARRHGAPRLHPFRTGDRSLCRATVAKRPKFHRATWVSADKLARRGAAHRDAQDRRACAWTKAGRSSRLRPAPPASADAAHRSAPARRSVFELPEGPAIAGIQALHMRAHAMDRAGGVGADQRAVGADLGAAAFLRWPCSTVPGGSKPRSTTQPKGMRGSARLELRDFERVVCRRARLRRCGRGRHRHRSFRARCR